MTTQLLEISKKIWKVMVDLVHLLVISLLSTIASTHTTQDSQKQYPFPENVTDIPTLNHFMESYFTSENEETPESWQQKLPTKIEIIEAKQLVSLLYSMDTFKYCGTEIMKRFPTLKKSMQLTLFEEDYCILHEKFPTTTPRRFARAFGYVVIASRKIAKRPINHSAAHFQSDGEVCAEAAAIFQSTSSRSLIVAGASRYAINGTHPSLRNGKPLTPDQASTCQKANTKTDAAHNDDLLFHHFNLAIRDASKAEPNSVYIQWHGMAETSCKSSDAFISAGGPRECGIYDTMSMPNMLAAAFNVISDGMSASTPRTDVECKLSGGTNVFGRYINGVPSSKVCNMSAENKNVSGQFIHIEQKRKARDAHTTWQKVIQTVMPLSNKSW